jgi:beta-galactosidase
VKRFDRRTGRPSGFRPASSKAVTRHTPDGRHWQVVLHHNPEVVPLPDPAHDLLTDALAHELPPGGCAVLRGH